MGWPPSTPFGGGSSYYGGGGGGGGIGGLLGLAGIATALDEEEIETDPNNPVAPVAGSNLTNTPLLDNTIVHSIGHYFGPAPSFPGDPNPRNIVIDFLINQTQETGGGATLPVIQKDLDKFTTVYHRIQAPAGQSFEVDFPANALATTLSAYMVWSTGISDGGGSLAFGQTYENLVGPVPESGNYSAVGAGNQFFTLTPDIQGIGDLSFSAVTFATAYEPRTLGLGTLTYQPGGFGQPLGTTRPDAYFLFSYLTDETTDPGRFVNFIPTPLLGDYNDNGVVDAADYVVWRDNLGTSFALSNRDPSSTGDVSQVDYDIWKLRFGATLSTAQTSTSAVPEPRTMLLAALAMLSALSAKRRTPTASRPALLAGRL